MGTLARVSPNRNSEISLTSRWENRLIDAFPESFISAFRDFARSPDQCKFGGRTNSTGIRYAERVKGMPRKRELTLASLFIAVCALTAVAIVATAQVTDLAPIMKQMNP